MVFVDDLVVREALWMKASLVGVELSEGILKCVRGRSLGEIGVYIGGRHLFGEAIVSD